MDPFLPGPLSGFSRLTSQVGIAVVALVTAGVFLTPIPEEPLAFAVRSLPFLGAPPAIELRACVARLFAPPPGLAA